MRAYRPGDEEGIVSLFNNVFPESIERHEWKWKFRGNPQGPGWTSVAEVGEEIVGHAGMARKHINFQGREVIAGHECDSMIRSDQRGKDIYTKLSLFNYELAERDGAKSVLGYGSRNSWPGTYPLLVGRLGWVRIANLHHYWMRIGLNNRIAAIGDKVLKGLLALKVAAHKKIIRMRNPGALRVVASSSLPDALEEALLHIRKYEVLSLWKDLPYLRWRYEKSPKNKYSFYILEAAGKPEGLVVTRRVGKTVAICELLHRRKDIDHSAILLASVALHYIKSDAQMLYFFGYDNGYFDAAFAAAGFAVRPFSKIIFEGKVINSDELEKKFCIPENWSVAYGDSDDI